MKKIILLSMCLVSIGIQAQQVRFIPKVGINIANMTNSDHADPRIGLNTGVSGEIAVALAFAVEPGIFYSMQGIKSSEGGADVTLKNDYINVPVLAKYYVHKGFNVFAGPQVGFLVNSELDAKTSGISASADVKDAFKTVDFGLVFGVGYQTDMGLNFSANYNLGLTNAFDGGTIKIADKPVVIGDGETKNGVIQLSVGWRF